MSWKIGLSVVVHVRFLPPNQPPGRESESQLSRRPTLEQTDVFTAPVRSCQPSTAASKPVFGSHTGTKTQEMLIKFNIVDQQNVTKIRIQTNRYRISVGY